MFLRMAEAAVQAAIASKVGAAARVEAKEVDSEVAVAGGGAVPCMAAVRALKDAKMHKAEVA